MNYQPANWLVLISLFFAGLSTVDAVECRATPKVIQSLKMSRAQFPKSTATQADTSGSILTEYELDLQLHLRGCAISEVRPRRRARPCLRTKQVSSTRSRNGGRKKILTQHPKSVVPQRWRWTVFQLLKLASPRVWCVELLTETLGYARRLYRWIHLQRMLRSGTKRTRTPVESGSWIQRIRL